MTTSSKRQAPPRPKAKKPRSIQAKGKSGPTAAKPRPVNLALQGGGAHGAFTWGVLDRLLEEPGLEIEGISATSAGAMNAAVMACGFAREGRRGAQQALDHFWNRVADAGLLGPLQDTPFSNLARTWGLEALPYFFFDSLSRVLSPYQFNPFNWNPLRDILEEEIDFAGLKRHCQPKLFVSATNVRSGKNRIFEHEELSADTLLASACLPFMFQAVEIDGEAYWDGGYMGNPAIYPLIYHCETPDVIIVQINPVVRDKVPTTATEILDRVNEISFNATLMREMRAIAFVTKLIDSGELKKPGYKRMNIHLIEDEQEMMAHGVASKLMPDRAFLIRLRDVGRAAAERWLEAHLASVGQRSSIDIVERFL